MQPEPQAQSPESSTDPAVVERQLARFAADLRLEDLPPGAVDAFERLILDFVSVAIAGMGDRSCVKAADTFGGLSCDSAPLAARAFAQGVCAHWFDWDDTHDESHVHGGAVIFPALLASWESPAAPRSPEAFVAATVAAFDIACRIGGYLRRNGHRGWMPTGSGGTPGAAAGAARLAGGGAEAIASAMGIAALNAGISRQALADRANAKGVLAALAAKGAVEAVQLGANGVQGPPGFFTGTYGLGALHTGAQGDATGTLERLGERFFVEDMGIKPYPCCRSTHAVIDAVLTARSATPALAREVTSMVVTAPLGTVERCGQPFRIGPNPKVSAQFSIPYTAAVALRNGRITLGDFSAGQIRKASAQMQALIASIKVRATSGAQEDVLVPVGVRLAAGERELADLTVTALKGDPSKPLSAQEQREKLRIAGEGVLSDAELAEVERIVRDVRRQGPGELAAWLRALGARQSRRIGA